MTEVSPSSDKPVVVLVRPQLGENVGTVARAMLNFGLTELRLVAPQFGWPNAKAVNACSGAFAPLNGVRLFDSTKDAVADLNAVFATTARGRGLAKPVLTARGAASEMRTRAAEGRRVGLLFGPERTGLETDELLLAEALVTVPLDPGFTSLNLAQAVLLLGYEWRMAADRTPDRRMPHDGRPANQAELDGLVGHLVTELDRADFFKAEDRRVSLSKMLRATFARAGLLEPEIHLLRGVVKALANSREERSAKRSEPKSLTSPDEAL